MSLIVQYKNKWTSRRQLLLSILSVESKVSAIGLDCEPRCEIIVGGQRKRVGALGLSAMQAVEI